MMENKMKNVKLAVVGSRNFNDPKKLSEVIDQVCKENKYQVTEVVSGGARGADTFAEWWANANRIPTKIFKPDWNKFGKRAGILRNHDIINSCDICIAFWDGESHGTAHDLKLCYKYGKDCWVYNYVTGDLYLQEPVEKEEVEVEDEEIG